MLGELVSVMKAVAEDVALYNNKSFLLPLFLIALLFLWVSEGDRELRVALLYLAAALGAVFITASCGRCRWGYWYATVQ